MTSNAIHDDWGRNLQATAKCDWCSKKNTVLRRCNICHINACKGCVANGCLEDARHRVPRASADDFDWKKTKKPRLYSQTRGSGSDDGGGGFDSTPSEASPRELPAETTAQAPREQPAMGLREPYGGYLSHPEFRHPGVFYANPYGDYHPQHMTGGFGPSPSQGHLGGAGMPVYGGYHPYGPPGYPGSPAYHMGGPPGQWVGVHPPHPPPGPYVLTQAPLGGAFEQSGSPGHISAQTQCDQPGRDARTRSDGAPDRPVEMKPRKRARAESPAGEVAPSERDDRPAKFRRNAEEDSPEDNPPEKAQSGRPASERTQGSQPGRPQPKYARLVKPPSQETSSGGDLSEKSQKEKSQKEKSQKEKSQKEKSQSERPQLKQAQLVKSSDENMPSKQNPSGKNQSKSQSGKRISVKRPPAEKSSARPTGEPSERVSLDKLTEDKPNEKKPAGRQPAKSPLGNGLHENQSPDAQQEHNGAPQVDEDVKQAAEILVAMYQGVHEPRGATKNRKARRDLPDAPNKTSAPASSLRPSTLPAPISRATVARAPSPVPLSVLASQALRLAEAPAAGPLPKQRPAPGRPPPGADQHIPEQAAPRPKDADLARQPQAAGNAGERQAQASLLRALGVDPRLAGERDERGDPTARARALRGVCGPIRSYVVRGFGCGPAPPAKPAGSEFEAAWEAMRGQAEDGRPENAVGRALAVSATEAIRRLLWEAVGK